jgi:hypothetical protein
MYVSCLRVAAFGITLAACGCSDTEESGQPIVPPCLESRTAVASDEQTSLAFSVGDVIAFVVGDHAALLSWPDASTTQVDFTVRAVETYFTESESNPDYTDEASPECSDHLEVDVSATFTTDDGRLNQTWPALTFRAYDGQSATATDNVDVDALGGTYAPGLSGDQCLLSLQFNLALAPAGFSGELLDSIALAPCDAIEDYTGITDRLAGVWEPM